MSKAKLRTCFIAVPVGSDWGIEKAKSNTWLTANDKRIGAKDWADHFNALKMPHKVVMFREVPTPKPRRNTK